MGFMICSYADESGDQHPGVYSVCGLIAKLEDFVELERRWRKALNEQHLAEFHAAKIENHLRPFDDPSFDSDRRAFLQRTFIGLITEQPIWGFNAFVEIQALSKHADRLRPFVSDVKPYTFSFRMLVEIMAIEVDDYIKRDPIAFVFDQQNEYEGRAKEIYDRLSTDGEWPLAYRLGSLSFQSRLIFVALQAADTWAYESRKHVADVLYLKHPERWQFSLFKNAARFNIKGYPEAELLKLIAKYEQGDDERPESSSVRQ